MNSTSVSKRGNRRKGVPAVLSRLDADEMAKRRCVMLLNVLSGESSISQAIAEAKISSALYYQLEAKALSAMLRALSPERGAEDLGEEQSRSLAGLEEKTKRLEMEKRRLERLLSMTKKVLTPGPMKQNNRGRPRRSTSSKRSLRSSKKAAPSSPAPEKMMDTRGAPDQASPPTPDGAVGP